MLLCYTFMQINFSKKQQSNTAVNIGCGKKNNKETRKYIYIYILLKWEAKCALNTAVGCLDGRMQI